MSNPRAWRGKGRTTKPNARQKRNKLHLDAHPVCEGCGVRPSQESHHELEPGQPSRYDWQNMKALCIPCHVALHQHRLRVYKSVRGG